MKKGKMILAVMAGLCVLTFSAVPVNAGGYTCDTCGVGLMNDYVEEKDVHTIGEKDCTHHKYGSDKVEAGMRRRYSECSYCHYVIYNGGWEGFTRDQCYGFD
ncbi:MAG: hypothetical protein HFH05_07090 [Lachnospiraceae bacterium]|jgi:hypothetical protein|nr:hypothetical protein [Lachnospiraceae bacterium]MCI9677271.1 hypothetical protein [Lachnospiraceae bacterium]